MTNVLTPEHAQRRLLLLTGILFIAYLCVGMALPTVPVFVTEQLHFGNALAGLGVGIAFLSTIVTRGYAGGLTDSHGAKTAVSRGLLLYFLGALTGLAAGWMAPSAWMAYGTLLLGRLLIGLGESLTAVGVIAWGIGLVGPARAGQVLALIGAAIYGALAVGGPIGLFLLDRWGFAGTMAAGALLPAAGLLAIWRLDGVPAHPGFPRPSFLSVVGLIRAHGAIVCLQGIGFAAIGAFFALQFRALHWPHAGLGLSAFGGGFVLVRVAFGHLPDRIGGLRVAVLSLAVEMIGQALISLAPTPYWALAGAFLTGLGCSMIFPAMGREVVRLVAPQMRGTAMGAFSAFQDLAYGLTGPLAGVIADQAGYRGVFLAGTAAATAGWLIALNLWRGASVRSPQ